MNQPSIAQKTFVAPMSQMFAPPNGLDSKMYLANIGAGLDKQGFTHTQLQKARDWFFENLTKPWFPTLAECIQKCREYQEEDRTPYKKASFGFESSDRDVLAALINDDSYGVLAFCLENHCLTGMVRFTKSVGVLPRWTSIAWKEKRFCGNDAEKEQKLQSLVLELKSNILASPIEMRRLPAAAKRLQSWTKPQTLTDAERKQAALQEIAAMARSEQVSAQLE